MTARHTLRAADKLDREYDLLDRMLESWETTTPVEEQVQLVLSQAKRVRRECNLLVRAIAQYRDQATDPGGHKL